MDAFVTECRREWKRLGVSGSAADEMAAELEADLKEGTLDEVLGRDAADAVGFARRWAVERGVVGRRKRGRIVAAAAVLAIVPAVLGAVVLIRDSEPAAMPSALQLIPPPSAKPIAVWVASPRASAAIASAQADLAHDRTVLVSRLERPGSENDDSDTLGIVLLLAGLAVLVSATLYWSARVALNR